MARQIINTGTDPNDGTGDPLRTALTKTNENFEEIYPITESVTKTVAADGDPAGVQDFDDFDTAMTWACGQAINGGQITLELQDGTHYTNDFNDASTRHRSTYVVSHNDIFIESASSDQNVCTITLPASIAKDWYTVFKVSQGELVFSYVTIDLAAGGNTASSEKTNISKATTAGNIYFSRCNLSNASQLMNTSSMCIAGMYQCICDNVYSALTLDGNSYADIYGTTQIINCRSTGGAIAVTDSSSLTIDANTIFSGNAADTNIPLNEIQPDGSYITDGTVPLIQADSVGTTAERPTARQTGHPYFDTTLGYEINWDGTNWVDSTGTTV